MSQRGGGFRGKSFKAGRDRQSPYSRGGGGSGYRKFQGGNGSKSKGEKSFMEVPPEMTETGDRGVNMTPASESGQPKAPIPLLTRDQQDSPHRDSSSSHTFPSPGHTPSQPLVADGGGRSGGKGKKYSVKARLFVGNLPRETSQEMVKQMFQEFGEVKEVFVQREKNFGFVRMVSWATYPVHLSDNFI